MKYFSYLLLAVLMPLCVSCGDSGPVDTVPPGDLTYRLRADKTEVAVGETVTFTVTASDGRDVTADCRICSGTNCFLGNTHAWDKDGTYTVEAHYLTADPEFPEGIASENTLTIVVGDGTVTYTLSADQEVVEVGESVKFTVTGSDGRDVTADCRIVCGSETFTGDTHAWQKAGNYEVEAYYMTDDTAYPEGIPAENKLTVSVLKPETTYRIEADKTVVRVGEPVVFSVVSSEEEDVSTRFSIREKDGATYRGRTRIYPEPGDHYVEAFLTNKEEVVTKNNIKITVQEAEVTVDPSRFYRRTLLAEMTATWCWSCHFMAEAIDYCVNDLIYDRAVVVAFHEGSSEQGNLPDIFTEIMFRYYTQLASNIPSYVMNLNAKFTSVSMFANKEANAPLMVDDIVAAQQVDNNPAGIAVSTRLSGRQLSVDISVTSRETIDYWMGAVLVEDNIWGYQHSAPDEQHMFHMNVGQAMISGGDHPAEEIGCIESGVEKMLNYSIEIPESCDPANCRVVAYVCKTSFTDDGAAPLGYLVSNAVSCPAGESVGYQYEPVTE